jgi:hypothetical protein
VNLIRSREPTAGRDSEVQKDAFETRLASILRQIETELVGADPGLEPLAEPLRGLGDRLCEGRFHLAVLGQFKRGKSTLLNALLGEPVLPAAVVPLTAVPTFVGFGHERRVEVRYLDRRTADAWAVAHAEEARELLERFVTEEANPENRLGVASVELGHPAEILAGGVVLVDTPGIGSTYRHNTEVALNFLSECDAALFLVSADPPITQVELEFLREVRRHVPRLFYLLNKVDYLNPDELEAALRFLRRTLRQAGIEEEAPLFPLSARRGLEARRSGDDAFWEASGLAEVEAHLVRFLARDKAEALRRAVAGRARELAEEGLLHLRLLARSLELPEAELGERLDLLSERLAEARRQKEMARDLVLGDQRRLLTGLEEQAESLRREAVGFLSGRVLSAGGGQLDVQTAAAVLAEAIPGFFERRLGEVSRAFEERVRRVLEPHRHRAERLIEGVFRAAADLFDVPYSASGEEVRLEVKHAPYWVTEKWLSTFHALPPGLVDRLLPRRLRAARRRRRFAEELEDLVRRNVENLRWSTLQTVQLTFLRFAARLDERLELAASLTEGALRDTATQRRERAAEVQEDRAAVVAAISRVEALARSLPASAGP